MEPRIPSLKGYDLVQLTGLLVQAFATVMLVLTNTHLSTRIRKHLFCDKNSYIFKQLAGSEIWRQLSSGNFCFKILDSASTRFQLKIKEAVHIQGDCSLNIALKPPLM